MACGNFLLNSGFVFQIDTDPTGTPTLAPIAAGIEDFDQDNNEEVETNFYLDKGGFAQSDVVGAQFTISFSGHRDYDDAAQNYIFSLVDKLGTERHTTLEVTDPFGNIKDGACTVVNIKEPSGATNAKGEISFEIHYCGKPTITPAT